jgi:hypothetical protein
MPVPNKKNTEYNGFQIKKQQNSLVKDVLVAWNWSTASTQTAPLCHAHGHPGKSTGKICVPRLRENMAIWVLSSRWWWSVCQPEFAGVEAAST